MRSNSRQVREVYEVWEGRARVVIVAGRALVEGVELGGEGG